MKRHTHGPVVTPVLKTVSYYRVCDHYAKVQKRQFDNTRNERCKCSFSISITWYWQKVSKVNNNRTVTHDLNALKDKNVIIKLKSTMEKTFKETDQIESASVTCHWNQLKEKNTHSMQNNFRL